MTSNKQLYQTVNSFNRRCNATFVALAVSGALLLGGGKAASAQSSDVVVHTKDVLRFQILTGQQRFETQKRRSVADAIWRFNKNGTFLYAPGGDVRRDLFPIQGRWRKTADGLEFSGSRSSTIGNTGSAHAEIAGKVYRKNGTMLLSAHTSSGMGNAAVVNNLGFTGVNSTETEFTISLP